MKRLDEDSRARFLARLARLLAREVDLSEALGALAADPNPAWAKAATRAESLAQEGVALPRILARTKLVDDSEEFLLSAADADTSRPLGLLAAELSARARLREAVRAVVAGPVWKFGILGATATMIGITQLAGLRASLPARRIAGLALQDPLIAASLLFVALSAALVCGVYGLRAVFRRARTRRLLEAALRESAGFERLLLLENGALFLRTLGTALEAGLPLPRALRRAQRVFEGRVVAREVEVLCVMAEDGASLSSCLSLAPFLDATTRWALEHAAQRPDLPGEMLALADGLQGQLEHETRLLLPLLNGVANIIFALPILLTIMAYTYGVMRLFTGYPY